MAANEGGGSSFDSVPKGVVKKFVHDSLVAIDACAKTFEAGLDALMSKEMHDEKDQESMCSSMEDLKVRLNQRVLALTDWIEDILSLEEIFGEDDSVEEKREIRATSARVTESLNRKLKEYRDAFEAERKKCGARMQWIDSSVESMVSQLSVVAQKAGAEKEE